MSSCHGNKSDFVRKVDVYDGPSVSSLFDLDAYCQREWMLTEQPWRDPFISVIVKYS
jgi:hypothetical protein